MTVSNGEFTVSTERPRLDLDFIHGYLSQESYWAQGMPMEKLVSAVEHSVNFGLYHGDRQIGYARVVTQMARDAGYGLPRASRPTPVDASHQGRAWLICAAWVERSG